MRLKSVTQPWNELSPWAGLKEQLGRIHPSLHKGMNLAIPKPMRAQLKSERIRFKELQFLFH